MDEQIIPDMEKIIKEKLDEMVELTRGLSYAGFMTAVENANDILALLKDQPQIVRCKDCKHQVDRGRAYKDCDIHFLRAIDDWFCADGKCKDGE